MSRPIAADAGRPKEAELEQRDWIWLPIISVLTICLFTCSVEWYARRVFARLPTAGENCLLLNDPSDGARGVPNCVVREKIPEGQVTEYRFNSNGYRNNANFGPKSTDIYRIVMVGTSVAAGFRVPQEQTAGALLPVDLSHRTGRKVEVYNQGLPLQTTNSIARHLNDAIAVNPDMILWIVSPLDISYSSSSMAGRREGANPRSPRTGEWSSIKAIFAADSISTSMATIFSHTRTAMLLKDLLYESPSEYVQAALMGADYKKDFLQSEPSAEWVKELKEFDSSVEDIEGQARKAGIPLVAVLVPDRTQAAMISMMDECPKGFDPYKLGRELRAIIVSHGGTYLDILPEFRAVPNPQLGYYAIDGHPNAYGQAMIARFLADKLAGLAVSAMSADDQPQAGLPRH
jgi:hypothetical protein